MLELRPPRRAGRPGSEMGLEWGDRHAGQTTTGLRQPTAENCGERAGARAIDLDLGEKKPANRSGVV